MFSLSCIYSTNGWTGDVWKKRPAKVWKQSRVEWQMGKRCIKRTHGELHNNLSGGGPLWQSCSRPAVLGPWGVPQERSLASLLLQIHTRAAWFYKHTLTAWVWLASCLSELQLFVINKTKSLNLSFSCSLTLILKTRRAIRCFGSNFRQNVNVSFISVESCIHPLLLQALKGEFMQNVILSKKTKYRHKYCPL